MTIQDFTHKYNFKHSDKQIAIRLYNGMEMKEEDWATKLKSEFVFNSDSSKSKTIKVVKNTTEIVEETPVDETEEDEESKDDSESSDDGEQKRLSKEEKIQKIAKIKSKTSNKK
jgi:hypothetical protein